MLSTSSFLLALATLAAAKPPSNSRTYAVDYFYGTGPLVEGRIDPIVSPGQVAGHVHTVMGGSAFGLTMSDTQALSANCTNSKPKADKSNYWWPKLYFQDPKNGSFIDVDLYYAKVYYFSEPTDDVTSAFPPGLRMTTGNAMSRAPNDKFGQLNIDSGNGTINPVQFVCGTTGNVDPWPEQYQGKNGIGYPDPTTGGHGVGFPDANCDGYTTPLRYDLHFPSCYNPEAGLNNYTNNMQFPSSKGATQGQNCPEGWIHTPHVFIEVYWNTPPFADLWTPGQGSQPFVLSNGDPTGYGLHGDFIAGWDEAELQNLIDNCNAGDSGFDTCPGIDQEGGVNDSSGSCTIPSPVDENIYGVMSQLPGCNPLQWGPGEASEQTSNCGGTITNTNPAPAAATNPPEIYPTAPAAGAVEASESAEAAMLATVTAGGYQGSGNSPSGGGAHAASSPVSTPATTPAAVQKNASPVVTSLGSLTTFTTSSASSVAGGFLEAASSSTAAYSVAPLSSAPAAASSSPAAAYSAAPISSAPAALSSGAPGAPESECAGGNTVTVTVTVTASITPTVIANIAPSTTPAAAIGTSTAPAPASESECSTDIFVGGGGASSPSPSTTPAASVGTATATYPLTPMGTGSGSGSHNGNGTHGHDHGHGNHGPAKINQHHNSTLATTPAAATGAAAAASSSTTCTDEEGPSPTSTGGKGPIRWGSRVMRARDGMVKA